MEEPSYQAVIQRHLKKLHDLTQRDTIAYISGWPQKQVTKGSIEINRTDADAITTLIHNLKCDKGLELIIHSPGGNVGAAMLIVDTIRSKANDARVIIPQYAMSAASMIACSANRLMMGSNSFMGPTDPQMKIDNSGNVASASDILSDFEMICKNAQLSGSQLALGILLVRFEPGLLTRCKKVKELSRGFVEDSLRKYMFKDDHDADAVAAKHAFWLCEEQQQHELYISREALLERGFPLELLEDHPSLDHEIMCVYYSATIAMSIVPSIRKMIDNQLGEELVPFL